MQRVCTYTALRSVEATVAPPRHNLHRRRALERIFQPLRNQIDHHIPSCTASCEEKERSPNHKTAKGILQIPSIALGPEAWQDYRSLPPTDTLREGAYVRKFAEPSDDLHHIACLSSVRACCC